MVMGFDSWCERDVIARQSVPPGWNITPLVGPLRDVTGISGDTAGHFIGVTGGDVYLRHGAPPTRMIFLVGDSPHGGGMIGSHTQHRLGITIDLKEDFAWVSKQKMETILMMTQLKSHLEKRPSNGTCQFLEVALQASVGLPTIQRGICCGALAAVVRVKA